MEFVDEPSFFLEYEVDTSKSTCTGTSLSHSVSFPGWHHFWNHNGLHSDSSLLTGSEDCASFSATQSTESKMLPGCNTTEWQLQQGKHGVRFVRCETWSYLSFTSPTYLQPDSYDVQQQLIKGTADSHVATFTPREELTETQNAVTISHITSTPSLSFESGQQSKLEPNREDRLLNLRDIVPAQTILSAIKSFDKLLSSKDDTNVAREECRQHQNNDVTVPPSLTAASHQSEDSYERSKCFGLPSRVTVSMREINMMSPSSF